MLAQEGADPSAQLRVGERFREHVIPAALEHSHPGELVRPRGQHDHRRVRVDLAGQPLAAADGVEQTQRVPVDVRQHQCRTVAGEEHERVPAPVGEHDLVAIRLELLREEGTVLAFSSTIRIS